MTRTCRAALVLVSVLLGAGAAACAKPRAEVLVAGPPLEIPAPPPRALAPVAIEAQSATAEVPPTAAPQAVPALVEVPAPAPPRQTAAAAPPPVGPPAAVAPVEAPPRELRVVPSADDAALERRLRTVMNRATIDLSRVDYQRLSANAREHYDQARRHLEMAERALKEDRNLMYALKLAEAGAEVAGQLVGAR